MIGHFFFATKEGRIRLATPGCKPGDKLCVFYGGEPHTSCQSKGLVPDRNL